LSETKSDQRCGPLAGLKVLDLTIMAAGPWAASLLGQLGADVIKVEPPAGDGTRWVHPYQHGLGTNYLAMNVNKRSVTLDLRREDDRDYMLSLVDEADVFIQNFSGGVADRLGVGYETLARRNAGLVYCSISGFGSPPPLDKAKAADYIIQAFSGFAWGNGTPADEFEQFRFTGFIDLATAMVAVQSVVAALLERRNTGLGMHLDVPMLEAALELQFVRVSQAAAGVLSEVPAGSDGDLVYPDGAYQTLDRPVFITVRTDDEWRRFCEAIESPELLHDDSLSRNEQRVNNRAEIRRVIEPILGSRPSMWWLRCLRRQQICVAVSQNSDAFNRHEQVIANSMIGRLESEWGSVEVGGLPWRFSDTEVFLHAPPRPGSSERVRFHG
jgi:crotonobetainyl-CoA:carnitine CoA-transferase CaiB-like acyl-CoA transferase